VLCNDNDPYRFLDRRDVKEGFDTSLPKGAPDDYWKEIPIDGQKLQERFKKLNPWRWRRMEDVLKCEPDMFISDGPSHCFLWKRGKRFKEIDYYCGSYEEVPELPEFYELEKLIGYLEWYRRKGKKATYGMPAD